MLVRSKWWFRGEQNRTVLLFALPLLQEKCLGCWVLVTNSRATGSPITWETQKTIIFPSIHILCLRYCSDLPQKTLHDGVPANNHPNTDTDLCHGLILGFPELEVQTRIQMDPKKCYIWGQLVGLLKRHGNMETSLPQAGSPEPLQISADLKVTSYSPCKSCETRTFHQAVSTTSAGRQLVPAWGLLSNLPTQWS